MNLTAAFTPDSRNCRYNRTTGERSWIDAICVDRVVKSKIIRYKFANLADSDHDLHIVSMSTSRKHCTMLSKNLLKEFARKVDWSFLSKDWNGPIDAENRFHLLEMHMKAAAEKCQVTSQVTAKKPSIPRCLITQRRRILRKIRRSNKRKYEGDKSLLTKEFSKNNKLIQRVKEIQNWDRRETEIERFGIWKPIKRILGNSFLQKQVTIDKSDISKAEVDESWTHMFDEKDPVLEPLVELSDVKWVNQDLSPMKDKICNMLKKKKCLYDKGVSCFILSQFMEIISEQLICLVGECVNRGFTPRNIKRSKIKLIPKADGKKMRPISIMHPIYRVFDFVLYQMCLERFSINHRLKHQFGFMPERGVIDYLVVLEAQLKNIDPHKPVAIISLDLQDAFENIGYEAIAYGMDLCGFEGKMIDLVLQHIQYRSSFIERNRMKEWRIHRKGTPQGGFLSPFLFAIGTCFLSMMDEEDFKMLAYADDICIVVKGQPIVTEMWKQANRKLQLLGEMLQLFGLTVNPQKTTCMVVSFGTRQIAKDRLLLNNNAINMVSRCKIIGNWFKVAPYSIKQKFVECDNIKNELMKFRRIVEANAYSFRGLPLSWAHTVLHATLRGRIDFYATACKLFKNGAEVRRIFMDCERLIGDMIVTTLDLKRKVNRELVYFLAFGCSIDNLVERNITKCRVKNYEKGIINWNESWSRNFVGECRVEDNPTIEPYPSFPTPEITFSRYKAVLRYRTFKDGNSLWIHILDDERQRNDAFRYYSTSYWGHQEISNALSLFIKDNIYLDNATVTIMSDKLFAKHRANLKKEDCLSKIAKQRRIKLMTKLNHPEKFEVSGPSNILPIRILFNTDSYYQLLNLLEHSQKEEKSDNLVSKYLHRYAFEQIDWRYLTRLDLLNLTLLSGCWRQSETQMTNKCRQCDTTLSTLTLLTQPCAHITVVKGDSGLTIQSIEESFSSLLGIRKVGRVFHKYIKFLRNQ